MHTEWDPKAQIYTIDCHYIAPGKVCAYLLVENGRALFVDNNTVHAVPRLLEALEAAGVARDCVDYAMVTHVHLDHAGGTAALLDACPNATALVHPKTFRHLAAPERLVQAVRGIYPNFDELYGEIRPVPEARMRVIGDGEALDWQSRTFEFFHTLGHASHHMCIHDRSAQNVFTGDAFGMAYRPVAERERPFCLVASPPAEFNAAHYLEGMHRILALTPRRVALAHFGIYENPGALAESLGATVRACGDAVAAMAASPLDGEALEADGRARMEAIARQGLTACGIDDPGEAAALLEGDIALNGHGLAAAAQRVRRQAG